MGPSALSCLSASLMIFSESSNGPGLSQSTTCWVGTSIPAQRLHVKGTTCHATSANTESDSPQENQASPQQQPYVRTYEGYSPNPYRMSPSVRRRPYNLEAKMRMKQYRREAMIRQREQELEEERRNFQLDYTSIYQKGAPGTVQGVIREIIDLGYFVTLPNGREGFLAASHLGCSGGIPLLERLFSVGQEITVRVIEVPNPGGRDRLYVRP